MKVVDPGHIYQMSQLGNDNTQTIRFVKRSGGTIKYDVEWPGLQTQEVIRVLIDRTQHLASILPCVESHDATYYLRMALWCYEARAYRRKQEEVNRKQPEHDDSVTPKPHRYLIAEDVPFNEHGIELVPTDENGHIILEAR